MRTACFFELIMPMSFPVFCVQKFQERLATFRRCSMPETEKEKWGKVFCVDMMSSEESDTENNEIIIVKSLPWRNSKVTQFFQSIDEKGTESKTIQAKRQRKQRVIGTLASQHPKPLGNIPTWAFTPNTN